MTEEWLPVVGYEGLYEVSDAGRVRSVAHTTISRNRWGEYERRVPSKVRRLLLRGLYAEVSLSKGSGQRMRKVHQLVLEAFRGPRPEGQQTRHLNGDGGDNRLPNLTWGTASENSYDKVRHGTHSKTSRTHCPRQHPLQPPNLDPAQAARGRRSCWSCRIARDAARLPRNRNVGFDRDLFADEQYAALLSGWRPIASAERTHCPRGHELVEPNLRTAPKAQGQRACKACGRAASYASWWRRKKNVVHDIDALADKYYISITGGNRG